MSLKAKDLTDDSKIELEVAKEFFKDIMRIVEDQCRDGNLFDVKACTDCGTIVGPAKNVTTEYVIQELLKLHSAIEYFSERFSHDQR